MMVYLLWDERDDHQRYLYDVYATHGLAEESVKRKGWSADDYSIENWEVVN